MRNAITLALALAGSSLLAAPLFAQERPPSSGVGGVAESGMEQGEAAISTRSDVSVSLESVPGTSGARVAVLGRAVSGVMTDVRACYAQAIERDPGTHGRIRVRLDMPASGRGTTDVILDEVSEAGLLRCVSALLVALPLDASLRPASTIVVLTFDNTAAHGAAEVAARRQEADAVEVTREEDRPTASDAAHGVSFRVVGAAGASDDVAADALRVLRSAVPGMLDCRRRAGRRDQDPSGVVPLTATLRTGAAPSLRVGRDVTVRDPRAGQCLTRALTSAPRRPTQAARVDVEIRFEP